MEGRLSSESGISRRGGDCGFCVGAKVGCRGEGSGRGSLVQLGDLKDMPSNECVTLIRGDGVKCRGCMLGEGEK